MIKYYALSLACLFTLLNTAQGQNLRINEITFATDVENRQPVDVDTTFTSDIGSVFCFTHVKGATDTTEITHVWYYKEQEKARIALEIKSKDWRTWSSKNILKSWKGRWRVLVEGPKGNVLATKNFIIK